LIDDAIDHAWACAGLRCTPARGMDLASPRCVSVRDVGWLKHRGLNWDPMWAQLDR
jgi:hypothetical protein